MSAGLTWAPGNRAENTHSEAGDCTRKQPAATVTPGGPMPYVSKYKAAS